MRRIDCRGRGWRDASPPQVRREGAAKCWFGKLVEQKGVENRGLIPEHKSNRGGNVGGLVVLEQAKTGLE